MFAKDRQGLQRRPILDQRNKEIMMAVLLLDMAAFERVRTTLRPEHFPEADRILRVVWSLVCRFYDEHGALPDGELLISEIESAWSANPSLLDETQRAELSQYLEWVFSESTARAIDAKRSVYRDKALKVVKRYIEEAIARKHKEEVLSSGQIVVNMPALLASRQQELERIEVLDAQPSEAFFPPGWERRAALQLFPTGIDFLDQFLGGGHAPREVYGLLGPFGSCKTTLVSMLAVKGAIYFNKECVRGSHDGVRPLVFIVSYEASKEEMRNRCLGFAGRISRRTLEVMRNLREDLSRRGRLKDYERRLFREEIAQLGEENVDGEWERAMRVIPVLNRHIVHLDMTGHERKSAGNGGIEEIAQRIAYELRIRERTRCGLVLVDYVGALCERKMAAENIDSSQLRHMIKATPLLAKHKIADAFDCPVWLVHQLSGEANNFNPAVPPNHTNASESKSFAENLDFCLAIGVPDRSESVALIACSKHRRQPPRKEMIIKIDGELNRVINVNDRYSLDPIQRRIVRRDEHEEIVERLSARAQQQAQQCAPQLPISPAAIVE